MKPSALKSTAAILVVAALTAATAQAHGVKDCAERWTALRKSGARGSQTRAQFMTTCRAIGSPGGAPKPVAPGAAAVR